MVLAPYAAKDVIIAGGKRCTVDADLKNTHWLYPALRATSEAGAEVLQEGNLLRVTRSASATRASAPVAFRLQLPNGAQHDATVEATVIVP